ncbi:MAG: aldose 1-epimerase family protein [Bacillota bacterium]|nr:aldose 1-epimerase family protein [Bacillota bacterium]
MEYRISNEFITVASSDKGAELCSIKSNRDGLEYLWQADPAFWGRHAPVLFPIVGRLKEDKTLIEGRGYRMSQHGFARDMVFEVVEHSETTITYRTESSGETKERYPYDFVLYIGYMLKDNAVEVSYRVQNSSEKNMFFSIGAHPGFNCPLETREEFEDYCLEFNRAELMDSYRLKKGLVQNEKKLLFDAKVKCLNVSKELFEADAIMLVDMESTELSLRSRKSGKGVSVGYQGFPYLGIWSKPEGAPFVCIEPWYGIADFEAGSGVFEEKRGVLKLQAGESFTCSFTIKVY